MIRLPPRITSSPSQVDTGDLVPEEEPAYENAHDSEDADIRTEKP